jgi:hypothetical protein
MSFPHHSQASQTPGEKDDERRRLLRLQMMIGMVRAVLSQDPALTPEKAAAMIFDCRNAALAMFPGKELAFDLIYKPRLNRALEERFGPSSRARESS